VVGTDGFGREPTTKTPDPKNSNHHQKDQLWERAEGEPVVKHFVEALRGNLIDVEEV
jgi:hypothetical protein